MVQKNRYVPDNPFEGLRVRKPKDAKLDNEERDPWSTPQLETMFSHEIFTHHKVLHPHYYWLPLIGLYTGARMNEICQLYVDDIVDDNGVMLFKFTDERPDQRLKNKNSRRVVPIHSELIRLGFLDYVKSVKALKHPRLFDALTKSRDGYSKNASNWFARFRKKLGINIEGKKQDFHSFRHNVSDFYKQSDSAREVDAAAILGHSDQMITFGRYGKNLEAKKLQNIIEQLDFRDVLCKVKPWKLN
ncbi:site-specific integrase [Alteromonas macleodii]|uniref:site-specific integrase n=1 Tax=Alteromonas macleodii TaxID=28108 RepID=UPI0030D0F08C